MITNDILEVLEARRPDDRCHHMLLCQVPSEGDLSHARPLLLGDLLDPTNSMGENGVANVSTCKHYLIMRVSRKEVSYMPM